MKVLGIVGWSGMGKTTLLERLIPELVERGLRVSLVKHSHKDIELDRPGKESHRLREAGCHDVAVVGRNRWGVVHELRDEAEPDLKEILAGLRPCDVVLVEGMKSESFRRSRSGAQAWANICCVGRTLSPWSATAPACLMAQSSPSTSATFPRLRSLSVAGTRARGIPKPRAGHSRCRRPRPNGAPICSRSLRKRTARPGVIERAASDRSAEESWA
ncbi:molybdopterin-guanine dinucleotide biosynthesis protein B [Ramlibacter monticola]|uniref:Molybdopterin-guanine dinucleotide biosynthesis protein B n=1 Tax=Ramlibacter monticola TaxID=1926872 RepID=A0A936YTW2_9BURK|nr:molybdopterin-guanine dinucleotide biosynthesis protein B [Ramlibacter monticola]